MKMKKDNNDNLRHPREAGIQSKHKAILSDWITQSSWVMTVFVFALVFSLSACGEKKEEAKSEKPTIKIGATFPLTGDAAEAGQAAMAAMKMTLEGLENHDLRYNYELVFEDNQMSAQKTATTANKMINMDKVKAIISFWNLSGNVANAIAEKNNILGFTNSYGESATNGKYNFNTFALFEDHAKLMVKELKKRKIKTVALFIDNSAMRQQYDVIKEYIKNNSDIEVVFEESFNPGEKNYKIAIAKASAKNPDMYLISGYPPSPFLFMKQLKEITGRNDNVSTVDTFIEINPSERAAVEGLWYIDSNLNGSAQFEKEFINKTKKEPQSCSGGASANVQIIVNAYEKAKLEAGEIIPNNDNVVDWIWQNVKDYNTSVGNVSVVKNGMIKIFPSVKQIQNGKPVLLEE